MAILKQSRDDPHVIAATAPANAVADALAEESIEKRRARRMAALKKVADIWARRPDIPADGLDYQRELRSAWRD